MLTTRETPKMCQCSAGTLSARSSVQDNLGTKKIDRANHANLQHFRRLFNCDVYPSRLCGYANRSSRSSRRRGIP